MAYENIDVNSLKNALNACKNSINHSITSDYSHSILNSDLWITRSKTKLSSSLSSLDNVYRELESKIDHYLGIADMISEYKDYESHNASLENENKELREKQYYDEWETEEYIDENGKTQTRGWYETYEDYDVTREINSNEAKIRENNASMEALKYKISASI